MKLTAGSTNYFLISFKILQILSYNEQIKKMVGSGQIYDDFSRL